MYTFWELLWLEPIQAETIQGSLLGKINIADTFHNIESAQDRNSSPMDTTISVENQKQTLRKHLFAQSAEKLLPVDKNNVTDQELLKENFHKGEY